MLYYDELIAPFLSTDNLRPALQQANEVEGVVYGTDAWSLIMLPKEKCISKYPAHEKVPNFKTVFDSHTKLKEPIKFSDISLFNVLKNVRKVPDTVPCEDCKGEGETECSSCGHKEECEYCEGSGYVDDRTLPEVYDSELDIIQIGEAYFNPFFMGRLETIVAKLCADSFLLTHADGQHQAHHFAINDVTVVIMPLKEVEGDKKIHQLKPIQ